MRKRIADRETIEQVIERSRVEVLYARTPVVLVTLLIISTIYVILMAEYFPVARTLGWYSVLLGVLAGRWRLHQRYLRQAGSGEIDPDYWLRKFRFWIMLLGLTIGSLSLVFPADPNSSYLFLQSLFPIGILAATVVMLPDFISFFIYVITLLLPIITQVILVGDRVHYGIGLLLVVMGAFLLKFSRETNEHFSSSIRLQSEKQALLEELEREKRKVDDRLERILDDSSNEIFVVDAETLDCLQVNRGAVKNLGYSLAEFTHISILAIFAEADRQDFAELVKPLYDGVSKSVTYRGKFRRKDGTIYPVEARLQLSIRESPIIVITARDVTERSEWEKKLLYQANYDQLTGLFNRHYMQAYMESVFSRAQRSHSRVGLLFLDLDNFKFINDTYGHAVGDEVLKETAQRIRSMLRQSDTPARTGGDEFTVLLEGLDDVFDAEIVARKLVERFRQPFVIGGREVHTTVSVGICIYPDDGDSLTQLMQYADMAMYKAKVEGRNGYCFFSPELCALSEEQMEISNRLRGALDRGEFKVYFQPIVDINNGRIVGGEALLRWHDRKLGDIPPGKFIPLAENIGLIDQLGTWVLEEACREAVAWRRDDPQMYVSVNASSRQFRSGRLVDVVKRALANSGLPASRLQLEITESLLLQDSETPFQIFRELNKMGIRLALDDFGTGYSSLSYLRRFPLHVLKIDRSFIRDLEENQNSRALVRAIIAMAHSLNLEVVAEGIENQTQLTFLRRRRVEKIQGFFYSPPVTAEEFRTLLTEGWPETRSPADDK